MIGSDFRRVWNMSRLISNPLLFFGKGRVLKCSTFNEYIRLVSEIILSQKGWFWYYLSARLSLSCAKQSYGWKMDLLKNLH